IDNFIEMSINKNLYFKSKDENKKSRYMFLVKKNKKILHENKNIYRLSDISAQILNGSDWEFIRDSRRQNYKMLFNELNETINFKPVFNHFPDDVVPLYFVILIKKDRTKFQKALINERIYCPIHWPIYNEIESIYSKESLNFQYQILSIPCDQRYNELDIKRIISTINNIN
ncbi:DegT/DnrJ/EryC1/StrS family aminotransferase, partial [Bacteroidales bacterium OttesenSCG-928-K22]|nr:DegT/DnrJ/EryC1/StrS family aminotransferase [Bacteroidales bacterium OttesenSCG-928-K22]